MHRPGVGGRGKCRHLGLVVAREKQRASGAESGDRKCDGEDSDLTLTTRPKSLKDRTLAHGVESILLMPSQQLAKCLMPFGPAGVAASSPPLEGMRVSNIDHYALGEHFARQAERRPLRWRTGTTLRGFKMPVRWATLALRCLDGSRARARIPDRARLGNSFS
jgi:hypothetical protein